MADAAVEWGQTSADLVELDFVDAAGAGQRLRLSSCAGVRFENVGRCVGSAGRAGLAVFRGGGGRRLPACMGYESWLERDHLRAFDSTVRSSALRRNRFGCTGAVLEGGSGDMLRTTSPAWRTGRAW